MFRASKIIYLIIVVFLISAFLVFLTIINFWLFINGAAKLIYIFAVILSFAIFFLGSYFLIKINNFKKEKVGLTHLLEKNERKFINSKIDKNRVSKVFISFNEGLLVLDENEKIYMINPKAKKILGIKLKNLQGASIFEVERLYNLKPFISFLLAVNEVFREEVKFKNLIVELSVTPLIFEENNMGKLIVLRDVTRERSLEEAKNESILSAVHQLKTSISSAKWSIKMLLDGDFGKTNEEQKDVMQRLYKRNDALFFLIENLLSAAKIEDGACSYDKTSADIQDIIQSVITYFQDKIKSKKIRVEFKKPLQRLPKIMLDKEKIEAVLQNLFDNALKYTNIGGAVRISLEGNEKEIRFMIKDSGIGIPKNQQGKIFNKFFKATNADKIETSGLGLGLFIAKKIIEDHNGRIWFESEENKGSAFCFTLPIKGVE